MFATPQSLAKRTKKTDTDRPTYIKQLLEEYENLTTNEEKKVQILANLGNFAYDPINYEYFRRFNVLDLFLNNLSNFYNDPSGTSASKLNFSIGAICNLCQDSRNKEYLLKNNLLKLLVNCLVSFNNKPGTNEELIVLNSIMIIIFVFDETTDTEIRFNKDLIDIIETLSHSQNKRLANVAKLFMQDYYNLFKK